MAAAKRLMKELRDLQLHPVGGAGAAPMDGDIMRWRVVLVAQAPYDFPIRIELKYSATYPMAAPKAYFETFVAYTGGATIMEEGKMAVCLNIFGNFAHVHTEWKDQQEGWTPAYTIETILVSLQALFSSDMISRRDADVQRARREALAFRCKETGHDGSDPAKYWPPLMTAGQPAAAAAAGAAGAGEGHSASAAGAAASATGAAQAAQQQEPVDDYYICYATKATGGLLGFGVNLDNPRILTFSSPCELLSQEAFASGVRQGATNRPFTHWVPIVTPYAPWSKVAPLWSESMRQILPRMPVPEATVKLCCSIMNSLVVEVMNAGATANDRFIDGYFAFFRILRQFASDVPAAAAYADAAIASFKSAADKRVKTAVPNLGEFLVLLLVSKKYSWADICNEFVEECDSRAVFWYVAGNARSPATAPQLINPAVRLRSAKVFEVTAMSRQIVCYQVKFLLIALGLNFEELDAHHRCCITAAQRQEIKDMYKAVTRMTTWDEYFTWLTMSTRTAAERDEELLQALRASEAAGYHTGSGGAGGAAASAGGRGGYSRGGAAGGGFVGGRGAAPRGRGRGW